MIRSEGSAIGSDHSDIWIMPGERVKVEGSSTSFEQLRLDVLARSGTDGSPSRAVQNSPCKLTGKNSKRTKIRCRSLVSLCIGNLGRHLEDIMDDIHIVTPVFPASVKAALLAISRRRGLLCDKILIELADESWEILDVSGSDVTDTSIAAVAKMCSRLQAVDISRCSRLTPNAVGMLVHCPLLHTLRCGGTFLSDSTARAGLGYILPRLNVRDEAEDSWEELDTNAVGKGAQALRWLVWPSIDQQSRACLEMECPRLLINPRPFAKGFQHLSVPLEAHPLVELDAPCIEDIDPGAWALTSSNLRATEHSEVVSGKDGPILSIAERFKLAFISRDERLAPKRAKNTRQNQRRAEKAWYNTDTEAKARALAGMARKHLKGLES